MRYKNQPQHGLNAFNLFLQFELSHLDRLMDAAGTGGLANDNQQLKISTLLHEQIRDVARCDTHSCH